LTHCGNWQLQGFWRCARLFLIEYPLFICTQIYPRKQEIGMMDNKPAQNIQDTFLNTVRKDKTPITVYLVSGVKLTGKIRSFDKYSVLLENNNQEQLIFKHAISTVVSNRSVLHSDYRPAAASVGPAAAAVPAAVAEPR
jgi:host factor-I protein